MRPTSLGSVASKLRAASKKASGTTGRLRKVGLGCVLNYVGKLAQRIIPLPLLRTTIANSQVPGTRLAAALMFGHVWINVTTHPTAEWIVRQITEAFPWSEAPRYLLRDRDRIYGTIVTRRLHAMGIRDKPIAPASPWQNGFAERLIGSIRRECLDHLVVLSEAPLRQILQAYARYYNKIRTHRSLDKDAPFSRPVQRIGNITSPCTSRGPASRICPSLSFRYTHPHGIDIRGQSIGGFPGGTPHDRYNKGHSHSRSHVSGVH